MKRKQTKKQTNKMSGRPLIGSQFGKWLVVNIDSNTPSGHSRWYCRCVNCGLEKTIAESTLLKGRSVSCLCADRDSAPATLANKAVKATKALPVRRSHDPSKPTVKATLDLPARLYTIWTNTARKCSPSDPTGSIYSKGIKLAKDWQSFSAFSDWALSHGFDGSQRLARKNPRHGFNSRNCYWE